MDDREKPPYESKNPAAINTPSAWFSSTGVSLQKSGIPSHVGRSTFLQIGKGPFTGKVSPFVWAGSGGQGDHPLREDCGAGSGVHIRRKTQSHEAFG